MRASRSSPRPVTRVGVQGVANIVGDVTRPKLASKR